MLHVDLAAYCSLGKKDILFHVNVKKNHMCYMQPFFYSINGLPGWLIITKYHY